MLIQDDQGKLGIWYPDYHLNDYGVYIEFFGYASNPDYDNYRSRKEQVYRSAGLEVISIGQEIPQSQPENHIINSIYRIQPNRYSSIRSRIYSLRTGGRARTSIESFPQERISIQHPKLTSNHYYHNYRNGA